MTDATLSFINPFLHELGVELVAMADGEAQLALVLQSRHMNGWQAVHGGVGMTLLDAAMSLAGRSLHADTRAGVTVEMKTSFLQPGGTVGERIVAKGKVLHHSPTLCFCDGELWNGTRLVAKAMGTFKYLRRVDALQRISIESECQ